MFITPNWPAPKHIHAVTTTRHGGVSLSPYDSFNLANHVGDDFHHVRSNRKKLEKTIMLSCEPLWLHQTHSTVVADVSSQQDSTPIDADGSYAHIKATPSPVLAVLTADCLPILMCNKAGDEIAAIHAGWRGVLDGIIFSGIRCFKAKPQDILVWIGPAISQEGFVVSAEIRERFIRRHPGCENAFMKTIDEQWCGDLYAIAVQQYHTCNVQHVFCSRERTDLDAAQFFSYRRENITGRLASLIWIP